MDSQKSRLSPLIHSSVVNDTNDPLVASDSSHLQDQEQYDSVGNGLRYYRILLAFTLAIGLCLSVLDVITTAFHTLALAAGILIYGLVAYRLTSTRNALVLTVLMALDGITIGLTVSELGYPPYALLLLLAGLYFSALVFAGSHGIRSCLAGTLGVFLGVATGFFLFGNTAVSLTGVLWVDIALTSGVLIGLCAYAVYQRGVAFTHGRERDGLLKEVKEQKLRIYEISRYLPKAAWDKIDGKRRAKIQRKPITIFFSDIVGFSRLSEQLEPETLSNVLSSYLAEMSKVVEQFNGTIDKFIGDAIMVTFGDDDSSTKGVKNDAIACVSMAMAMKKRMHELQVSWSEMGIKEPLEIRMGINSGYCTVGTFGISKHLDHTALGVHVNLASRLESAGQPGEILVSYETWSLINDTILCKDKGKIKAKGFTHPVQVYQVINHRKELGSNQSYFSQTTDGFSIHLDLQKVKSHDREKVVESLELATKKLKAKIQKTSQ